MSGDYVPIECGCYDQLEILAMRKSPASIRYRDQRDGEIETRDVIVDVFSKDKQEFLKLSDGSIVRLDRLISVNGTPIKDSCES